LASASIRTGHGVYFARDKVGGASKSAALRWSAIHPGRSWDATDEDAVKNHRTARVGIRTIQTDQARANSDDLAARSRNYARLGRSVGIVRAESQRVRAEANETIHEAAARKQADG